MAVVQSLGRSWQGALRLHSAMQNRIETACLNTKGRAILFFSIVRTEKGDVRGGVGAR